MVALYNEIDPFAADWLENPILCGAIAPGIVDRRSVVDLTPEYLMGFTQVHLFAGIGVWSYALRQAGWGDDRPCWTASFPCQPFSAAGQGAGFDDERHLWPFGHWLISVCRPSVIFGEQVSSKDGLAWLDLVQSDMEATGYAFGALDLCSAGVGAPHIRQRTHWMAYAQHDGGRSDFARRGPEERAVDGRRGAAMRLADQSSGGRREERADNRRGGPRDDTQGRTAGYGGGGGIERLADNNNNGRSTGREIRPVRQEPNIEYGNATRLERPGPTNGRWADADWLFCRDGKWRPVMPGSFPLADGAPNRVGRLRGYGNAINAPLAQVFIETAMEYLP